MWRSPSISNKIWLSLGILMAGYFLSIAVGFFSGIDTETRLTSTDTYLVPALHDSQAALTAFNNQVKLFEVAFITGDVTFIEKADIEAEKAQRALQEIVRLAEQQQAKAEVVIELLDTLKRFNKRARDVFTIAVTDIGETDQVTQDNQQSIFDLAQTTKQINARLTGLKNNYHDQLSTELATIIHFSKKQRFGNVLLFIAIIIISGSLIQFIVRRFIANPLKALAMSEERFRNLFNNAEVGMLRTRFDGSEILAINQKLLDIFGRTREEVKGLPSLIHWAEPKEREAFLRRIETEGRVSNFEGRILSKQGEVRTCIMSVVLYREQGILEGSILDITERKKIEKQLSESENKYRLITENIMDVITIMDMNLRFTYVSPSIYRIRGFSVEEAIEQTLEQVMTPKSLQILFNVFEEEMRLETSGTADPDRVHILELEEYKKDGSTVWLENTLSFIRDKDQKPMGILALTRDITERKQAEEKLQRYSAELEEKNKDLQDALANVKQLTGMLPICASCKKIRDDKGYWSEVESYIGEHTQTVFSHGICPDCEKKAYEDLEDITNENT